MSVLLACMHVRYLCAWCQKRVLDPLEELQMVVTYQIGLGIEHGTYGKEVSALNR